MVARTTFQIPDLRALYSSAYSDSEARWRELGAIDKAAHLLELTEPHREGIRSVLEVGCGTGAVLRQLQRAGRGLELNGIEVGTSERAAARESDGIRFQGYDGASIPFPERSFDLVYATHVLEHVAHPRLFLAEMRRVARELVFLEVPCELNLRSNIPRLQTGLNIGHINLYTPESFALTLETSGLRILALKVYDVSFDVHAFAASRLKAGIAWGVRRLLLKVSSSLAPRILTYHCAALCTIAAPLAL